MPAPQVQRYRSQKESGEALLPMGPTPLVKQQSQKVGNALIKKKDSDLTEMKSECDEEVSDSSKT